MADRLRQGIYLHLIGYLMLLLLVICTYILFNLQSGASGCFLILFIFALLVLSGLLIFGGLILLFIGGDRLLKTLVVISSVSILMSPLFLLYAVRLLFPLSAYGVTIFIFVFLSSLVLPYLKLAHWFFGTLAIIFAMASSLFVATSVLFSGVSMNVSIGIGLFLMFFVMLVFSTAMSLRRQKSGDRGGREEIPEGGEARYRSPAEDREKPPRSAPPPDLVPENISEPGSAASKKDEGRSSVKREIPRRKGGDVKPGRPRSRQFGSFAVEEILREFDLVGDGSVEDREPETEEVEDMPEEELELRSPLIDGETLYDILRIPRYSDRATIRKGYRKRALMYHPDLNPKVGPEYSRMMEEEMRKINLAKDILKFPGKKKAYDRMLKERLGD